jgi:DNA polymerase-1
MAQEIFGEGYTGEQRSLVKAINFGLLYDRSEEGLISDGSVPLSRREARTVMRNYYARLGGYVRWRKDIYRQVQERHYVETPLGRRRRFPMIPPDKKAIGDIQREAIAFLPQSSANDATLFSLTKLHEMGYDLRLTVHDSIMAQIPRNDAEDYQHEMGRVMEEAATELYGEMIPFEVESDVGRDWGSLDA